MIINHSSQDNTLLGLEPCLLRSVVEGFVDFTIMIIYNFFYCMKYRSLISDSVTELDILRNLINFVFPLMKTHN